MKTTKHFDMLKRDVKEIIYSHENPNGVNGNGIRQVNTAQNRSVIYEIVDAGIILKKFLPKGRRDKDINALIDLDGIEYFPKLYAYKECEYLFMEKAQGVSLPNFIESGAADSELNEIKELLVDAFAKMLDRKRMDSDFKLEHIFWSKKDKKLTWIDLGICDKRLNLYPSKEEELKNFEEYFRGELSQYGINI